MKLDEVVAWYQKKIGTYDKQPWEKTVEQRILNGFINVPLKSTTLRTEYIDVDLVRGSTFPKAKPKQSLLTVLQLAVLRYLLLPIYAKWWVAQTSPRIFAFFLFLYTLQMFNWAIYSYNVNSDQNSTNESGDTCVASDRKNNSSSGDDFVTLTELIIPMSLSLTLSLIHSQIVATSSTNVSASGQCKKGGPVQSHRKKRERKRRRKSARNRSSLNSTASSDTNKQVLQQAHAAKEFFGRGGGGGSRSLKGVPGDNDATTTVDGTSVQPCKILTNHQRSNKKIGLTEKTNQMGSASDSNCSPPALRKRNVNWDSPIKSHVFVAPIHLHNARAQAQVDAEIVNESREELEASKNREGNVINRQIGAIDDDGFESLNGKSSSGEEMPNAINRLAATNEEIFDNSSTRTNEPYSNGIHLIGMLDANGINNGSNSDTINETAIDGNENSCDKARMRNLLALKCSRIPPIYTPKHNVKTYTSDDDEEDEVDGESQPSSPTLSQPLIEGTSSATEWIGITTNSEECSYSSADNSESQIEQSENNGCGGEWDYFTPTVILNSSCAMGDRISCTVWDGRETKKAEMSVLDISSAIIERVEAIPETCDYVYIGLAFSLVLSLVPAFCRLCEAVINSSESTEIHFFDMPALLLEKTSFSYEQALRLGFGETTWQKTVLFIDFLLRFFLTFLFFFLLAVAERTFKQRFLYAKLFSHLTSSRRARKSELPHFRLNKVRNIKTWLSVRSYLKRRGPQRSVDVIVSAAFILTLLLLAFLSVEWLKDSVQLQSQHNLEALIWSCALGCFLLRFMTLGTKINRKYRSISVLITEQINLYLQIEQKPHNKDELMVSNSVLKLAADLLKELDSPFKISGLSANPYLYTTVKVVILSALSGVLSEMLGFKLKLHKIKIK